MLYTVIDTCMETHLRVDALNFNNLSREEQEIALFNIIHNTKDLSALFETMVEVEGSTDVDDPCNQCSHVGFITTLSL